MYWCGKEQETKLQFLLRQDLCFIYSPELFNGTCTLNPSLKN